MAKITIFIPATARSNPRDVEEKAEAIEVPFLNEIRVRQKKLKPEAFSTEKVKVK